VVAALVADWGADPDAPGDDGLRPLELALRGGHDDAFFALLAAGASVMRPPGETQLLHVAAAAGRLRPVARLLEGGADVHGRDAHGWSALEHAAAAGHEEVRRSVSEADRAGFPAQSLTVAADWHSLACSFFPTETQVVTLLADAALEGVEGDISLTLALRGGHVCAARALAARGALRHLAAQRLAPVAAELAARRSDAPLLDAALAVRPPSAELLPALVAACASAFSAGLLRLLNAMRPADVRAAGATALRAAAAARCAESVRLLLAAGARPRVATAREVVGTAEAANAAAAAAEASPLLAALQAGAEDCVVLLLDAGADLRFG
jgi:ankyrin repeat protein